MDLGTLWLDVNGTVWSRLLVWGAIAVVLAVVVTAVLGRILRMIARRRGWPERSVARLRRPFRWLLIVIGLWIVFDRATVGASWDDGLREGIDDLLQIAVIAMAGWLVAAAVSLLVDLLLARYRTDVADNRVARRVQTQALILRRVGIAAIVVVTVASALLVFPAAQAAGASLLASAGVISIIAGVAAQSTLGNVVAGVQLAFSGAIRVDDVVIANDEWGRIEEITLTYVVVHVWDDRRLVIPSTYFTTTPFENWTRTSSRLMQSVDFDLDWRVDPPAMRDEMHRILGRTDLWDRRVAVLQVTDAVGGMVHVRILVTAADAPTLFDLRCFVREEMIRWLQEQLPEALPRTRVEVTDPGGATTRAPERRSRERTDRDLFGGSAEAEARGKGFTGPVRTHPS